MPGEAEAQDVLFVSNLDQGEDTNTDDARDRAQRFTTGSNPAGYTLTSVEIRSEDPQSDDATVSICTVDGRGYPTSSCTPLTAPSSFAAGILVFSAPNDHSLSANTSYALVVASPGDEDLRLDATRADGEDSAEVAGWSIADAYHTDNTSGWGITGSGKSLRIAVKGLVKIASNAATGIVHPRVLMDTQITVGGYRVTNDDSAAGIVDFWGYAAGQIKVGSNTVDVRETVHDGSLDDAGFAYGGVEYTVSQLTITSDTVALLPEEVWIEIEDAQGTALPDTAAVGIELQGSPTERARPDRLAAAGGTGCDGQGTAGRVAQRPGDGTAVAHPQPARVGRVERGSAIRTGSVADRGPRRPRDGGCSRRRGSPWTAWNTPSTG